MSWKQRIRSTQVLSASWVWSHQNWTKSSVAPYWANEERKKVRNENYKTDTAEIRSQSSKKTKSNKAPQVSSQPKVRQEMSCQPNRVDPDSPMLWLCIIIIIIIDFKRETKRQTDRPVRDRTLCADVYIRLRFRSLFSGQGHGGSEDGSWEYAHSVWRALSGLDVSISDRDSERLKLVFLSLTFTEENVRAVTQMTNFLSFCCRRPEMTSKWLQSDIKHSQYGLEAGGAAATLL